MAHCNLCSAEVEDLAEHLHAQHPDVDVDGASKRDNSTIEHDIELGPDEHDPDGPWQS